MVTEERLAEIRARYNREMSRMMAELTPPPWDYEALGDLLEEIDQLRVALADAIERKP